MDTGFLLNTVLNGVLGARTKRSHRARHYLTGGLLSNPAALVTAAGLAWGAFETFRQSRTPQTGVSGPPPQPAGSALPPPVVASAAPPPLPAVEASPVLPEPVKRLLRLATPALQPWSIQTTCLRAPARISRRGSCRAPGPYRPR